MAKEKNIYNCDLRREWVFKKYIIIGCKTINRTASL